MGETTALFFGDGESKRTTPIHTVDQRTPSTELGATLAPLSEDSDRPVVATSTHHSLLGRPLPGIDRCDCRIQALDAIRVEMATWTLGTVPDLEVWAHEVAGWIVELPTEDLRTFWPGLLALDLHEQAGLSIQAASGLIQRHVGVALLTKEARR